VHWTFRRAALLTLSGVALLCAGALTVAWLSTPGVGGLPQAVHVRAVRQGGLPVSIARVSPLLREAVVATEDERFYSNHGIDVIGILRAIPYDAAHLSLAQGASTITEQVAKLLYLQGNDHDPWRKLEDVALAIKLESRYDKPQILAAYLNSVYLGSGATGVDAASRRYFGIRPAQLDLSQASLLAGLIQAPSAYDPLLHPAAARQRQVEVLRALVRTGYVAPEEAADVAAKPLPLRGGSPLPPVTGVDFAPGPAFVWSRLGLGAALIALAVAGWFAVRRLALRPAFAAFAVRAALALVIVVGFATVVRSFRTL
jgi:Transglycosylase